MYISLNAKYIILTEKIVFYLKRLKFILNVPSIDCSKMGYLHVSNVIYALALTFKTINFHKINPYLIISIYIK